MRLFLDANILFTAARNPKGKATLTIELGRQGHWVLATSTYALAEARRNLERKFSDSLEALKSLLEDVQLVEHPPELWFPPGLARKNRPIYQAAVAWNATHLLTGDTRDFGRFMDKPETTSGVVVQTVVAFLDSLTTLDFQSH